MQIPVKYRKIIYFIYLTVVTVAFLFWLFPEDKVRNFVKRGVAHVDSDISVDIGGVSPLFPPGLKLKDISVQYKGAPVATPAYIRTVPRLLSLFGQSPRFFFKTNVFGGIIHGDCQVMDDRSTNADIRITGIKLEDIKQLRAISPHRITGLLDGDMTVNALNNSIKADSNIEFEDFSIELATPFFDMDRIMFHTVKAELSVTPRRLQVTSSTFEGEALSGTFTGYVIIRAPLESSIINLKGFVKPQAAFIKNAGKTLPLDILMKKDSDGKGFPIMLRGTLQEPQLSLR